MKKNNAHFLAVLAVFVLSGQAQAQATNYSFCGPPLDSNAFGRALDYNDPNNDFDIHMNVEENHFDRDVEMLVRGKTGELPIDIAYVLFQIPNHHRALAAMSRWERAHGYHPDLARNNVYSIDCYFRRALTFRPNDATVHMLYGMHLHVEGESDQALNEYLIAKRFEPDNVEINYNLGLLYVELGEFEKARESARLAYGKGFPLMGLKSKLERLGEWQ